MAAELSVSIIAEASGLGKLLTFLEKFTQTTTPTAFTYNYRTLATADTEEALDLGDVTTVEYVVIKAVSGPLYVDTSFSVTFSNEIIIPAGEIACFKPGGTLYVKNYTALGTPTYEYLVSGTT
jgi:hypothetical protein